MTQIPEWANWLARDKDGTLLASEGKPEKGKGTWLGSFKLIEETDDKYSCVQWEDLEPWEIKRTEYGSFFLRRSDADIERAMKSNSTIVPEGAGNIAIQPQPRLVSAKAHGFDEPPTMESDTDIYGNANMNGGPSDLIRSPNHYIGKHGLEVETVLQNFLPFYEDSYTAHRIGSAVEYLLRAPRKNGVEDLKKAHRNIGQILEYIGEGEA